MAKNKPGKLTAAQLAANGESEGEGSAPEQAPPPVEAKPMPEDDGGTAYRPRAGEVPGSAGPVVLGNWIGRVADKRRSVSRLTPVCDVPKCVVDALVADGIAVGAFSPAVRGKGAVAVVAGGKGGIVAK